MGKALKKCLSIGCIIMMIISLCACASEERQITNGKDVTTEKHRETQSVVATEDTIDESSAEESTTAESETDESTTDESTTAEIETDESTTEEATIGETTTKETITNETATNETTTQEVTTEETTTPEQTTEQSTTPSNSGQKDDTPYGTHGRLAVLGTQLVDQYGHSYALKGVSTHGIAWFPDYVSYDTFKYLRDQWGANVVRIAMYTSEYGGYCNGGDKDALKKLVKKGVDAATDLGLYVVIDWHILSDGNPWTNKDEAIKFFDEMSSCYKDYDNIIYEICNEPNGGTSWSDVKSYAMEVISVIRANDGDAIILVGTPTWSQDVDTASWDKITGYDNIMYTLHFYAATHKQWIRDKAQTAIDNGCALFVSEFSICDASGNGGLDKAEANQWLDFLNDNGISFIGWNLANKNESSSLFQSWCNKTSGFDDSELSEWAKWLRDAIQK